MKISATNNNTFRAGKLPQTGVKVIGELGDYSREMLNRCHGEIDTFARSYGKQVKIAQKGKSLLVNSGNVTSSFNPEKLVDPERDFAQNIIANIRANNISNNRGLGDALGFIKKVLV